ncbi:hypothetical protein [Actinoplanes sp. G11-F43]|uniref:hypothetical protein n=1 Tax=Actinoplanes sp. G11-F43 TaxID=3424130 RepID=UPI003D339D9D
MTEENDSNVPNQLEKNLLWLGYEEYTGLWQVVIEVSDETEPETGESQRDLARNLIQKLLDRGWIEIYLSDGPLGDGKIMLIPLEERQNFLDSERSWNLDEEDEQSVWFATTDEGITAYRRR